MPGNIRFRHLFFPFPDQGVHRIHHLLPSAVCQEQVELVFPVLPTDFLCFADHVLDLFGEKMQPPKKPYAYLISVPLIRCQCLSQVFLEKFEQRPYLLPVPPEVVHAEPPHAQHVDAAGPAPFQHIANMRYPRGIPFLGAQLFLLRPTSVAVRYNSKMAGYVFFHNPPVKAKRYN